MNRRTNGGLREGTEDTSDPSLDAGWDEVPESRAVPVTSAPRTLPPMRTASESRSLGPTTIPSALRPTPPPSKLPPVTIAPRPRPSTRVPAHMSQGPLSMRGRNVGGGMLPAEVGSLGSSDDPTLEISFQFLDEALLDLVEGPGPCDAETPEPFDESSPRPSD
jgi:hypothetical protein